MSHAWSLVQFPTVFIPFRNIMSWAPTMSTLLLISQFSHFLSEWPTSSSAYGIMGLLQPTGQTLPHFFHRPTQWPMSHVVILITTCLVPNSYTGHLSHSFSQIQDSKQLEERKVSFGSQLTGWSHQGREGPSRGWGETAGAPLLLQQEAVWSSLSEQIRGPRKAFSSSLFYSAWGILLSTVGETLSQMQPKGYSLIP